jgi:hypothetical protein
LIVETPVSLTSPNPIDFPSSPGNSNGFLSTESFGITNVKVTAGDLDPQISGVPEISTWAMMLIGFGLVGFKLRRRVRIKPHFRLLR